MRHKINGAGQLFMQCMSQKLVVLSTRDTSLWCTSFSNINHISPAKFKFFADFSNYKTWDPLFFCSSPSASFLLLSISHDQYQVFCPLVPLPPSGTFLRMFKTHRTKDLKAPAPTTDARHLAAKRDKKARWYMGKGENFFFRMQNAICL